MTGIRKTDNEQRLARRNVHYLFSVRNMFFSNFGRLSGMQCRSTDCGRPGADQLILACSKISRCEVVSSTGRALISKFIYEGIRHNVMRFDSEIPDRAAAACTEGTHARRIVLFRKQAGADRSLVEAIWLGHRRSTGPRRAQIPLRRSMPHDPSIGHPTWCRCRTHEFIIERITWSRRSTPRRHQQQSATMVRSGIAETGCTLCVEPRADGPP